jgi:hypothetical protein
MKLKAYNEKEPGDVVTLMLKRDTLRGGLLLIAVEADGTPIARGNLLKITEHGTIIRYTALDPKLGFQLDSSGKIQETN